MCPRKTAPWHPPYFFAGRKTRVPRKFDRTQGPHVPTGQVLADPKLATCSNFGRHSTSIFHNTCGMPSVRVFPEEKLVPRVSSYRKRHTSEKRGHTLLFSRTAREILSGRHASIFPLFVLLSLVYHRPRLGQKMTRKRGWHKHHPRHEPKADFDYCGVGGRKRKMPLAPGPMPGASKALT